MRALLLFLIFRCSLAFAGVEQISEKEFAALAQELAPKVNLFREGWKKNPDAEFYGGTTRDYLYWLKGQFQQVHNADQAKAELAELRALTTIDVRDFIIGDSDVDIISAAAGTLDAKQFGVRKIDFQSPDILDPATDLGKNEILQGYIPAEKIRLGKNGFHPTGLGNGVKEIYDGRLSVHFATAEDFAKSTYAKEGINHPILLALRFIRVQAINYFRTHGAGLPDKEVLFQNIDAESALKVRNVIEQAIQTGELDTFLEQSKFTSWINGAIQKSFRSYTNPTAAKELMTYFGVDRLAIRYAGKIEPLNQYIFAKYRDEAAIQKALAKSRVNESEFYRAPSEFFPDGRLYHGTRTEDAFRGILLQGVLPSESGSAGGGLYGVGEPDKGFSEAWANDKNRLLFFPVKSDAKIVDITKGEGARIFQISQLNEDDFAERFGADILAYPYDPQAFVVKNSGALEKAQGVYRKIMPLGEILKAAKSITAVEELQNLMSANGLSTDEISAVWRASNVKMSTVAAYLEQQPAPPEIKQILEIPYLQGRPEVQAVIKKWLQLPESDIRSRQTKQVLEFVDSPNDEQILFIDSLFRDKSIMDLKFMRNGEMLKPLTGLAQVTPNATAFALFKITDPKVGCHECLSFLATAKLSPAEQDRLWHIYQSEAMKPTALGDNRVYLASGLLRNNKNIQMVKADLFAVSNSPYDAKTKAQLLIEYFPQDREVAQNFLAYVKNYMNAILTTRTKDSLAELNRYFSLLKYQDVVKPFLFERLSSKKEAEGDLVKGMLESVDLSDDEWIQFLQKVKPANLNLKQLEKLALKPVRSPELGRALLKAYLDVPYELMTRSVLREVIVADANPAIVQAYVRDKLLNTSVKPGVRTQAMSKAMHFLTETPSLPHSPEVEDAMFAFLEKSGKAYFHKSNAIKKQFLTYLPVENSSTAARLQNLIVAGKIGKFNFDPETLIELAERMQSITPEFSSYIQDSLKASEPMLLADFLKSYRERFGAISHKVAGSCPKSFAILGGTP